MNFELDLSIPITKFLSSVPVEHFDPKLNQYRIKKVVTDTRKYENSGGIFFAIEGKNFNGHNFIKDIIEKIDYVVISDRSVINEKLRKKYIVVEDTTVAFCKLAEIYRLYFPEIKIISVVGSNGKTTVKEIISKIFSQKYKTVFTQGNFNTSLGIAYTFFSLKKDIEYCITEIGISQPGEMKITGSLVRPDVVVFTNIGKEHLEFLSDVDNVFKEETEILNYLSGRGFIVINNDDEYLSKINHNHKFTYGINDKSADVHSTEISLNSEFTHIKAVIQTKLGSRIKVELKTQLLGLYNVYNVLAGIATSFFSGIDDVNFIVDIITNFEPLSMRGRRYKIGDNIILDETYNANPSSMKTSITEFVKIFKDKKMVLVLGDMLELGKVSKCEHEMLLEGIDMDEIHKIFLYGNEIIVLYEKYKDLLGEKIKYYENKELLIETLISLLKNEQNLAVLLKSSRKIGLDEVVLKIIHAGQG